MPRTVVIPRSSTTYSHNDTTMTDKSVFESSDSVRHAKPLKYAQHATFDGPFHLERGRHLPSVTVAYETYGTLNPARDNAVLICHAISGDSHVAQTRRAGRSRLVGYRHRSGQGDRHQPLLRDLPQRLGRLPRHDGAEQLESGHGPSLWAGFSVDHDWGHCQAAEAVGEPFGHRAAAGRRRRVAGRPHGLDLGHAISGRTGGLCGDRHEPSSDQPGPGF